jgi:hypothetical protein
VVVEEGMQRRAAQPKRIAEAKFYDCTCTSEMLDRNEKIPDKCSVVAPLEQMTAVRDISASVCVCVMRHPVASFLFTDRLLLIFL